MGGGCWNVLQETDQDLPILKTLVPQMGQSPLVAGRPFFNVTCSGLLISRFSRHFRQYASMSPTPFVD